MDGPSEYKSGRQGDITVADIFAPTGVEQFLARSWNQSLLYLPGTKGRFETLLGWPELNRLLEECPLDSTQLRVMRNGKKIADDLYLTRTKSLDAGALSVILAQGATIVIDFIDSISPSVGRIADAIAGVLWARAWVNSYASWGNESGLKLHSDCHDVIILQMGGNKHWTVYGPTRSNPNEGDVFEAPAVDAEPAWSGVLSDGDVLYIPRGWPHVAVPTGEPSLHLTVSLGRPTGSDYFRWLASELDKKSAVRAAIPSSNATGETDDWLVEMRELVEQAMSARSVDAFLNHDAAEELARPRFSLPNFARIQPNDWSPGTLFRLATTRRLGLSDGGDGTLSVSAANRQMASSAALAPALKQLSSNNPLRLDMMEAAVGASANQELRRTLAIMVSLGILFSEQGD